MSFNKHMLYMTGMIKNISQDDTIVFKAAVFTKNTLGSSEEEVP